MEQLMIFLKYSKVLKNIFNLNKCDFISYLFNPAEKFMENNVEICFFTNLYSMWIILHE